MFFYMTTVDMTGSEVYRIGEQKTNSGSPDPGTDDGWCTSHRRFA